MTKTLKIAHEDYDFDAFTECDSCGMRSYYFVQLESGLELSYCIHHFQKYPGKLGQVAETVVDMSHLLGK